MSLNTHKSYNRYIRPPVLKIPERDKQQFFQQQSENLKKISGGFKEDKITYGDYYDPNLIFKITLEKNVSEKAFIKFLDGMGIQVLSESPGGKGVWIALSKDEDFNKLKEKLSYYADGKYEYADSMALIDNFGDIPVDEKLGQLLIKKPLDDNKEEYLDVELWKMDKKTTYNTIDGIKNLVSKNGGEITDQYISKNISLLRVKAKKEVFGTIMGMREVCNVDRPAKFKILETIAKPIENITMGGRPEVNAVKIAIFDTGITSNHPLLENAVLDEQSFISFTDKFSDDVGHGTQVAGIALYGDVEECIHTSFKPESWLISVKLMYLGEDGPTLEERFIFEKKLEEAVDYVKQHENCRIINLSLGFPDRPFMGGQNQARIAATIDEIAEKYDDTIFVISAGNIAEEELYDEDFESYPKYLLSNEKRVKLIDPATSIYALTVGSIAPRKILMGGHYRNKLVVESPALKDYPSPFTKVGPGLNEMIKPDLVEYGGNVAPCNSGYTSASNPEGGIITLEHDFIRKNRLFGVRCGTSVSAPKISHYLSKLINKYPEASSNLIKALLISSASWPNEMPEEFSRLRRNTSTQDNKLMNIYKIYGYGKPKIGLSLESNEKEVLIAEESSIVLNQVKLHSLNLPEIFMTEGDKEISFTLTYNPPIRRNRKDYMGVTLQYGVYNAELSEVEQYYELKEKNEPVETPNKLKLQPGENTLKKTPHQKASIKLSEIEGIDPTKPLIIAVESYNKWIPLNKEEIIVGGESLMEYLNPDVEFSQNYAVVVAVRHLGNVDLDIYQRIKKANGNRILQPNALRSRVGIK